MRFIGSLMLLLALAAAPGCGHTYSLATAPSLGQLTLGSAHVWRARDGSYRLEVDVYRLPRPQQMCHGACGDYVVWVREPGGATRRLGNLALVSMGGDSTLTGVLKSLLPGPKCEIFITAEPGSQVSEPSRPVLLSVHLTNG